MNNINELLAYGNPIFKAIEEAVRKKQYEDAYMLLDSEPPKEWVKSMPSIIGKEFHFIDIEINEAVMTKIFKYWGVTKMDNYMVQDRSKFAVTTNVVVEYDGLEPDVTRITLGTATVKVNSIELLELATPKSLSMAQKNAFRRCGNFLGKSLNREFEDERTNLPVIQIGGTEFDGKGDVDFEEVKSKILAAPTQAEAMEIVSNSLFKHSWKYNFELKQLIESKK